jgi:hypothetical protein
MSPGNAGHRPEHAPTPRELWLRGATDRSTPFVAETRSVAPAAAEGTVEADTRAHAGRAGDEPDSASAESKRRDQRVPGQFGLVNAPRKAAQAKPAPDKTPAAKPAKPSFSAGVWRRPFSQPDR